MPEKQTLRRARQAKREGKAPSTQAGEFVREEIEHVRRGRRGARSTAKQAIAIGLSKARREGVTLPPPARGKTSESTRKKAVADVKRGRSAKKKAVSQKRSRASLKALRRERRSAASEKIIIARGKKRALSEILSSTSSLRLSTTSATLLQVCCCLPTEYPHLVS